MQHPQQGSDPVLHQVCRAADRPDRPLRNVRQIQPHGQPLLYSLRQPTAVVLPLVFPARPAGNGSSVRRTEKQTRAPNTKGWRFIMTDPTPPKGGLWARLYNMSSEKDDAESKTPAHEQATLHEAVAAAATVEAAAGRTRFRSPKRFRRLSPWRCRWPRPWPSAQAGSVESLFEAPPADVVEVDVVEAAFPVNLAIARAELSTAEPPRRRASSAAGRATVLHGVRRAARTGPDILRRLRLSVPHEWCSGAGCRGCPFVYFQGNFASFAYCANVRVKGRYRDRRAAQR